MIDRTLLTRLALFLAASFFLSPIPHASAIAAEAPLALRIVYASNTHGVTRPCPTCGNAAYGGLARRASAIKYLRAASPCLVIAGPGEFPSRRESGPNPESDAPLRRVIASVHDMLGEDLLYLDEADRAWFGAEADLPTAAVLVDEGPTTTQLQVNGILVGVVLFPPLNGSEPDEDLLRAIVSSARRLQQRSDLVIGISPWGLQAESRALRDLDGAVHLLLGAGKGIGFPAQEMPDRPTLLWARSESRGRGLTVIDLRILPSANPGFAWNALSYHAEEVLLDTRFTPQPAVQALIDTLPQDIQ